MKVILVNGSPNAEGCTFTALNAVGAELNAAGIETQLFQLGKAPIEGCRACRLCFKQDGCVIDDNVNEFVNLMQDADGVVFGSPVHFASATGKMVAFLDRACFSSMRRGIFRGKVGACVVSARRAGTTAALDQLNKYLTYGQMVVATSRYWNMVHGTNPDEVRQDLEGMQVMRVLGRNMAWILRSLEAGRQAGIEMPEPEKPEMTNFIR